MSYQPHDGYFRRAKREGYRSRAAYKLLEINRRYRLMRPGDTVVDLGAAPGGWLQVAAELVGPGGRVLGFDLQPIRPLAGRNVRTFELDVLAEGAARRMGGLLDGPAECVLSDMAPRLSGIRDADQRRALELARTAYVIAGEILKPGGSLVFKTFTGPEGEELMAEIASRFRTARAVRAAATRKGSSEIYVVVRGFQGRARRAEGASGAGPGEGARG